MHRIILMTTLAVGLAACTKDTTTPDAGKEPAPDAVMEPAPDAVMEPEPDMAGPDQSDGSMTEVDASPVDAAEPAPPDMDASSSPDPTDGATPEADMATLPPSDGGEPVADGATPGDLDQGMPLPPAEDAGPPPEPLPPGECVGQAPDPDAPAPDPIPEDTCMNCVGAPTPTWRLEDFQPLSCGLGQTYGVDTFHGAPTLVALFNAGCGYCQGQCAKLEEMRIEFRLTGFDANLLAVNSASNLMYQDRLAAMCSIPLFQDTEEDLAMESMDGSVFDMYIYRPDGTLHVYLSGRGEIDTSLRVEAGYENVKAAIVSAAEGTPYEPPFPPVPEDDAGLPGFPPIPVVDAGADE